MTRQCGSCNLCCKLLRVVDLPKPPFQWCEHCDIGKGCSIYPDRPRSCVEFRCMWLAEPWLPESFQPNKSKIIFEWIKELKTLIGTVDPANLDWRTKEVMHFIEKMVRAKQAVVMIYGAKNKRLSAFFLPPGRTEREVINDLARLCYVRAD